MLKISQLLFIFVLLFSNLLCASAPYTNIYAFTQAGMLTDAAKRARYLVYVPNGLSGTVSVIDPLTYQVIQTIKTDKNPQHVVPAYNMQTLWVLNNQGNSVTPIDPFTGLPGKNIPVNDPYNLYFTPDGQFAIVVCEARKELELRDPNTMQLVEKIPVQCRGANHLDFTPDGRFGIVTCEFSGQLMKVDFKTRHVVGYLSLGLTPPVPPPLSSQLSIDKKGNVKLLASMHHPGHQRMSMPQDIRSTSDGKIFMVADMMQDGLILIDPDRFMVIGFIAAGIGTHGIYPSRNGRLFYVSNRGCHQMSCKPHGPGSVSVIDTYQLKVIANWHIPNGGSPDMGNITPDGRALWLSGRYDNEVYVFDTLTGVLTHRIAVGRGPHGLAVWPQPGRYSLGHTGNMR